MKTAAVITAWNSGKTIGDALASVLGQTVAPDSIVVVDAGSTDNTARVAEHMLAAQRIEWSLLELAVAGPSAARNSGWQKSDAEWIQFLDADDVLRPHKLAVQLPFAAAAAQDVAVIHSPWQRSHYVRAEWMPVSGAVVAQIDSCPVADLLRPQGFFGIGAALFKRDWLARVGGFDERYSLVEDVHCYLRMALAGARFVHAPAASPVFEYRQHPDSLSRRSAASFGEAIARNAALVEQHFSTLEQIPSPVAQQLATRYWQAAYISADASGTFAELVARAQRLDRDHTALPRKFKIALAMLGARPTARMIAMHRRARRYLGMPDTR